MVLKALPWVLIIGEDIRAAWSSRLFPGFSSFASIPWLHGPCGSSPGLHLHQGSPVLCPRVSPPRPRRRPRVSWSSRRTTLGSSSPPEETHCLQGCQQSSLAVEWLGDHRGSSRESYHWRGYHGCMALKALPGVSTFIKVPWFCVQGSLPLYQR